MSSMRHLDLVLLWKLETSHLLTYSTYKRLLVI